MPIRWLAWDFGGVLTEWDSHKHLSWLAQRYGVSERVAERAWRQRERAYGTGRISPAEYWAPCQRAFDTTESIAANNEHMFRIQTPRRSALSLLRSLKPRYRMALITNIFPGHLAHVDKRVRARPLMDLVLDSTRIRAWKPDRAFWRILCQRTGAKPEEIVVIDDHLRNIQGARAYGCKAIHFKSTAQLRRELRALGVRPERR